MALARADKLPTAAAADTSGLITIVIIHPITNVMQEGGAITLVKTIADRLKEARESLDLSQEAVAIAAGVRQGTIGNIESGARKNPRELLAIAAAVGVNPQWLKTGKGPRTAAAATPTVKESLSVAPPDLAAALEVLGMELARNLPDDVRQDVADTLAKLAHRKGQQRHQDELLRLLSAPPSKQQSSP